MLVRKGYGFYEKWKRNLGVLQKIRSSKFGEKRWNVWVFKRIFYFWFKKKLSKDELEDLFLENLNLDTLEIYAKNLESFGLAQKDVADFLMCRAKTISNLCFTRCSACIKRINYSLWRSIWNCKLRKKDKTDMGK